jgi:hypothetical protein
LFRNAIPDFNPMHYIGNILNIHENLKQAEILCDLKFQFPTCEWAYTLPYEISESLGPAEKA